MSVDCFFFGCLMIYKSSEYYISVSAYLLIIQSILSSSKHIYLSFESFSVKFYSIVPETFQAQRSVILP